MDCSEYREWIAADVDGAGGERCAEAHRHADQCPECRAARADVARVRSLLRSLPPRPLPVGLRTRILARLDDEAARAGSRRRWPEVGFATAGLALAVLAVVGVFRSAERLDSTLAAFRQALSGELPLAVESSAPDEVERHYERHASQSPSHVIDLSAAGFHLRGGIVLEVGGRQIRLTTYDDGVNTLVCGVGDTGFFPTELPEPGGSLFLEREGINFCIRRLGDHLCVLATRMPMDLFKARMAVYVTG